MFAAVETPAPRRDLLLRARITIGMPPTTRRDVLKWAGRSTAPARHNLVTAAGLAFREHVRK